MYKTVLIVLAEGFEDIEAVNAIDTLTRAGIKVTISGITTRPVRGAYGCTIIGDTTIDKIDGEFDCLVFTGGKECAEILASKEKVVELVDKHNDNNKTIAAICAASNILLGKRCKMLEGKIATGDQSIVPMLRDSGAILSNKLCAVDRNIITAMGPGSAMQFALAIVESLAGKRKANEIAGRWQINRKAYAPDSVLTS
jgi:4-methyl-5(b-hydroxyethyl)-thiazole monophosphate biosynthesis